MDLVACDYCGKEGKKKKQCHLCKSASYCDEDCRVADWADHQLDCNIHDVKSLKETVFVPYFYEDQIFASEPEDALERIPEDSQIFQGHQIRHVHPNGTIYVREVAPLVGADALGFHKDTETLPGGSDPLKQGLARGNYNIRFDIDGSTVGSVDGKVPDDFIFKSNKANEVARELAGGGLKGTFSISGMKKRAVREASGLVFWPDPKELEKSNIIIPTEGEITVYVTVQGKVVWLRGLYRVEALAQRSRVKDQFRRLYEREIRKMLKGGKNQVNVGLENTYSITASDLDGNRVVLTVNLIRRGRKARVLLVQFLAPIENLAPEPVEKQLVAAEAGWDKHELECNPRDISSMTSLCMAIEELVAERKEVLELSKESATAKDAHFISEIKGDLERLQADFAPIRALTSELEEGKVPQEIDTVTMAAIGRSIAELNVSIDKSISYYVKGMRRHGYSWLANIVDRKTERLKRVREERDALRDRYQEATGARGVVEKAKVWPQIQAKRALISRLRRDLRNLDNAISARLREAGLSNDEISELQIRQMALRQIGL